ncbi:hypothetical protein [Streptomyces spinosisporus]|uniref:Uncharacterized protein n=1 Tax=Streptomyces spinosisporus TaxID=2927582 RepID=A0ABS9XDU3_9ACTN|nr:hypothetical protein [Streptomyces spinosisporus]MCI3240259.1 hypothetical protein [Streptomyces spinosisporus]
MRRIARALYLAYGAQFAWLAVTAVYAAYHHALWACGAFAVGSGLAVVAFMREGALEDARLREAARAERAAHTAPAAQGPPLTDVTADVVAVALAAACCERWWTSAGAEHDPNHCTRKDQTT